MSEMASVADILTDNLDIWTSAIERRSTAGRGRSKKFSLYGIEKLRALILDLAVRGKLVPQEPSDEPASELLQQIRREKTRLAKLKEIKAPKPLPLQSDPPFALPRNWSWSQIAEVGVLSPRNDALDEIDASFVPMPMIAAEYGTPNEHEVRNWGDIKTGYTHFAEGDVGLAKITPCFENGKSTVFRNLTGGFGSGTTELHIVRPLLLEPDYILIFFKSPYFIKTGIPKMTGTAGQKRIPTEYFAYAPFPLPPLAEQRRIIVKIDELMALCDALEAKTYGAIEAHELLVGDLLATLIRSENADELAENWARVETHFDTLLTTEASIDQLKQTIMQLAVKGKLVPQDPNDEPASELLRRISADKAQRAISVRDRRAPRTKPLSVDQVDIEPPANWVWVYFGDLVISRDGERIPISREERDQRAKLYDYYGASGIIDKIDGFLFDKPLLLIGEDGANLINRSTPIAFIARGQYWVNNHAHVIDGLSEDLLRYLEVFINSIDLRPYVTGTAQPKMNQAKMNSIPVALPPSAEQRLIITKVDNLINYCEELKIKLSKSQKQQIRFADALAAKAVA